MVLPTGASYRRRAMATVTAVSAERTHSMSKPNRDSIRLLAGLGVEGDAHLGQTVRHLSRIARDPTARNLRQVHLIHAELHDALRERGFDVSAGQLGENLTTRGVDPLALPVGTLLHLGATAVVEVTGLRNPCRQLEGIQAGLMAAVLNRDSAGRLVRLAGIMAVVRADGDVRPGDPIAVELCVGRHCRLEPV